MFNLFDAKLKAASKNYVIPLIYVPITTSFFLITKLVRQDLFFSQNVMKPLKHRNNICKL